MRANPAQIALTTAAFTAGVVVGCWLSRPREAPKLRTYDREAVGDVEAAQWLAQGNRLELEQRKRRGKQGGGTA